MYWVSQIEQNGTLIQILAIILTLPVAYCRAILLFGHLRAETGQSRRSRFLQAGTCGGRHESLALRLLDYVVVHICSTKVHKNSCFSTRIQKVTVEAIERKSKYHLAGLRRRPKGSSWSTNTPRSRSSRNSACSSTCLADSNRDNPISHQLKTWKRNKTFEKNSRLLAGHDGANALVDVHPGVETPLPSLQNQHRRSHTHHRRIDHHAMIACFSKVKTKTIC